VDNPRLSYSTDLDSYFGYCYAKIIPPVGLENYLIHLRDNSGKIYCPSTPFEGIYWSELLKASRDYNYKIEVLGGFKFDKGENIFSSFVNNIYEKRIEAKEKGFNSLQLTYKLILNALYGRFGMKDLENKLEIVNFDDVEMYLRNKNITLYSEMNNKCLIKYNTNISSNILSLLDSADDTNYNKINSLANIIKQRPGCPAPGRGSFFSSYCCCYNFLRSNRINEI
jgi:hypothetical protein